MNQVVIDNQCATSRGATLRWVAAKYVRAARLRSVAPRLLCAWCFVLLNSGAVANETSSSSPDDLAFFETKIRPVLVEHCYSCHSADAKELQGSLLVDSREGLLAGGDSGTAIVPGKPGESLLIDALKYETYEMPPAGKLPDEVIADFERWIERGAADPRTGGPAPVRQGIDLEKGRQFWSFQPVKSPAAPAVKNASWPVTDVDRFLLAKLEEMNLAPAPDASRATWLRRVTFDLTGLPPTAAELAAFDADATPDAYARVVDHLLASPHFGERWGRHWLDAARFAESTGGGRSIVFKDAWRYRDYVIDAINRDKPVDEFIVEQLAGDLLPHDTPRAERNHLVATAYLLLGAHNYEEQDKRLLEMDVVDEQLDAIGRGLLGMTISCARCHDHKFDPIPTADYYALAGILRSTHVLIHENVSKWTTRPVPASREEAEAHRAYEGALATAQSHVAAAKDLKTPEAKKLLASLKKDLAALQKAGPPRATAMAVADAEKIEDCQICIRGSIRHRGAAVPRGVLQVATSGEPPPMPADASGRLELARWIASPTNPLTARVFVNRAWAKLFGRGLVRTLDNFGSTGELPSHPELLDFLAARFVDDGWSAKRLLRDLVLSHAYRMSSDCGTPEAAAQRMAADPENRLLWRFHRRRLDAEALRDAMLAASGQLDLTVGGPNIQDVSVLTEASSTNPTEYGYVFADTRRSVYTPAFRNRIHELFEAFDFANQNTAVAERNVTTVAPQALLMLNSAFVMAQAQAAAARGLALPEARSDDQRLTRAFVVTLGREPSEEERTIAAAAITVEGDEAARLAAWQRLYQALFGSIDFRYLD